MNQNGYNSRQGAGYGQPNGYPGSGYPGGSTYPGYPSQQGYQGMQGYPPQQGYPSSQGYPSAQGYGSASGFQTQAGSRQSNYQTPQVTASQPSVEAEPGYSTQGMYYQNPYAQQNYPSAERTPSSGVYPPQSGNYQNQAQSGITQSYAYQSSQAQQGGGYIPQTPYSQSYSSSGYPVQPSGYSQGYSAYGQMGRNQQMPPNPQMPGSGMMPGAGPMSGGTNRQVPLNGGGYVPQPVPVKRKPFEMTDADLLILSAILLILFALGMFVASLSVLKWIFLVIAAGTIALLWIKPLVATNKRLCYTIVFVLLMAVTVIGFARSGPSAGSVQQGGGIQSQATSPGQAASPSTINPEPADTAAAGGVLATPEPSSDHSVTDRLETFFYYWSANRQDDMLTLCSPSWQSKVENPKTALFGLMANRTPKDYMVESVSGTDYDTSRTVTIVSSMDRNNGKDPVKYRLSVIMLKESEQWYVDPQSLQTYEAADTPDPSITNTPAPTETPAVYANTPLYYNPSGGEYYHLDQNCKKINERYLPLQGHFTYAELNKEPYSKLKPCAICGAPLRD